VQSANVALGCKYYTNALHVPCSSADNVWASSYGTNVPFYTAPPVDWDSWYANAAPGPMHGCTSTSGVVPTFDTDGVRNNGVATSFSLTPAASYSCKSGTGEISWDAPSRTLTVNGTVFVDGSVKVDNALVNTFAGQGTLYLSGTFLVSANTKLCAKVASNGTDCDMAGWDPSKAMLVVLTNSSGGQVTTGYGAQVSNSGAYQGAIYSNAAIQIGSYAQFKGPMIATTVVFGSYSQTYTYGPMTSMPSGAPGTTASTGHVMVPESYSG
jgi:hypothetical protein